MKQITKCVMENLFIPCVNNGVNHEILHEKSVICHMKTMTESYLFMPHQNNGAYHKMCHEKSVYAITDHEIYH